MKKPPLVEVHWHDAFKRADSATQEDAVKDIDYSVRYTVGWLVLDSDKKVIVAMTYDPEEPGGEAEYDDRYTIPRLYVQSVRYIERGKRKPKEPMK